MKTITRTRKPRQKIDLHVPEGVELREIPGLGGKYVAGSDGHIYCYSSLTTNSRKPQPFRVMEKPSRSIYPCVATFVDNKRSTMTVHVLVCLTFHGPKPTPQHQVRHLDGSRANNRPDNLAWGTPGENQADRKRHGTATQGVKHPFAKLSDEAVRILKIAIPQGLWNYVDAAKVFGCSPSVVRNAVIGKTWKHVDA